MHFALTPLVTGLASVPCRLAPMFGMCHPTDSVSINQVTNPLDGHNAALVAHEV